ncbi:multidrug resistance protein, partial [Aureobasidium pullulans]
SSQRVFSYADKKSCGLYAISLLTAAAAGTTLPIMEIVFGKFVTAFNGFAAGTLSSAEYIERVEDFTLYFIYLFVAKFGLVYVHSICASIAAIRTTKALRIHYLETLLRRDMTFFDSKEGGSPSSKVTTNGNLINNGISDKLSLTVQCVSTFVSAFVVALVTQWKLALICTCILPIIVLTMAVTSMIEVTQDAKVMSLYTRAGVLAEEAFSNITTVHAFWLHPLMTERYDALLNEAERQGMKKSLNWGFMFSSQFFCVYAGYGLAFWQGIRMWARSEIAESGTVVTQIGSVIFSLVVAATSMTQIALQMYALTKAASSAGELFRTIDTKTNLDPMSKKGLKPDHCVGNIEIENLHFAYPSRPDNKILTGLSLTIPANKTTALVGTSGSGKSTIVAMLERWYDPTSGSITLDGIQLLDLNLKWLRTHVRLVQQEPVLFSGTIFDNVAHGLLGTEYETASTDQKMQLVQEACKSAYVHEFVQEFPEQYLTEVGERAKMLSGGQKQRIAIARSIVSNPPVLLLDEATSALDPRAEKVVQEALDNVSKDRTTLVIAHKLSTIQKADKIAVLSEGVLVQEGTHEQLLTSGGAYAKLVRAQDLENFARLGSETCDKTVGECDVKDDILARPSQHLSLVESVDSRAARSHTTTNPKEKETKESMGYSLIRCLYLLIKEQPALWRLYSVVGVTAILGAYSDLGLADQYISGCTMATQAILFGRTLQVFQTTSSDTVSQGDFWALMFFVVALASLFLYFVLAMVCNIISQKVTHIYRLETFENTIYQEVAFFDEENNAAGAIISRLSRCTNDLQELLSVNAGLIFNNIITVASCSILGIAYGWKLGLVCTFGALPPLLLGGYFGVRIWTKLDEDTTIRFASSAAVASEAIAAIRTVASLTLEETVLRDYDQRLSDIASTSTNAMLRIMFWYSLTQSVNFLAMALGFCVQADYYRFGGKLVSSGEYSTEQFYVVFVAIVLGGENATQVMTFTTSISKATEAANYIFFLRDAAASNRRKAAQSPVSGGSENQCKPLSVTCDGLEFAYPTRQDQKVVNGLDVHIPAGKFVALVGASGCGKSTVLSLLLGFYEPTSGSITLDDRSISEILPREHRRRLAIVQQEPVLYTGSIRENVEMGMAEFEKATDSQVEDALSKANILDFVRSLPEGVDTYLGNRGNQLSGGQRQRIAIARALIRDPKLLLLDEATSALDTESEKVVQAALVEAANDGNRTTIAVAHRLSTIKDANIIFVCQAGTIVEAGDHATLLLQKGVYAKMCQGQALDRVI